MVSEYLGYIRLCPFPGAVDSEHNNTCISSNLNCASLQSGGTQF